MLSPSRCTLKTPGRHGGQNSKDSTDRCESNGRIVLDGTLERIGLRDPFCLVLQRGYYVRQQPSTRPGAWRVWIARRQFLCLGCFACWVERDFGLFLPGGNWLLVVASCQEWSIMLGSLAMRPSEFIGFLDDILKDIRSRQPATSEESRRAASS